MQQRLQLSAQRRDFLGKKVHRLRSQGLLPGHIYGHDVDPVSVSVKSEEFVKIFAKAGETGLIDLVINDDKVRPVLIHDVQYDPAYHKPLNIDFYQVNLSEKVAVNVPVEIIGESPVVNMGEGVLLAELSELEVEALPTDLPEKITVDVSSLNAVGDVIHVKDLHTPAGVIVKVDPEQIVVHIGQPVMPEKEEVAITPEAPIIPEAVAEEGTPPAETPEAPKGITS
ncbi:50S ribosomal protein L25 [Candidatus Daviesbacteria bacterium]|nr:50S ribosomal protein L25 [Candidatus Daviesbacteria bacterium]